MANILSIETSTNVCSVALHNQGRLQTYVEVLIEKSHAERLTHLIDVVTKNSNVRLSELDAIAVSEGPGSYTGLRIGSSTAKGLVYALDIPLIAVSTLETLATQVIDFGECVCPLIDARRMEVFCALYKPNLNRLLEPQALILSETSFLSILEQYKVIFVGDGAQKTSTLIQHPNALFLLNKYPRASDMGTLAFEKWIAKDFASNAYFEPNYLKPFYSTQKIEL